MKKSLIATVSIWILYVLLHFCYKWFPNPLFLLLGCPEESLFHHMKMAFFAYTFVSVGEFLFIRKQLSSRVSFAASRMLSVVLFSFLVYVIWYPVPLFFGVFESVWGEVLYSNIVLVISLILTKSIEVQVETIRFRRSALISITFIYGVILIQYAALPFMDAPVEMFEVHSHGSEEEHEESHNHEDHSGHRH